MRTVMGLLTRNAMLTLSLLAFGACSSTPSSTTHSARPSATAVASSIAVPKSNVVAPFASTTASVAPVVSATVPAPPPEDPAVAIKRQLAPKSDSGILLLGVHLESINGYGPMFSSEGKPQTDPRPGYMTLVIRSQNGSAETLGTVPYVAVPQGDHFVYMGEASVSVHLPNSPSVTMFDGSPMPRDYDATELWQTDDRKRIPNVSATLVQKLKKKRAWGVENTSQLVYVTPKVLCKVNTESEVTGGALYFRATSTYSAASLDATVLDNNFAKHVSEKELIRFASEIFEIPIDDVDLDKPLKDNFMVYSIRDDIQLCFDHIAGTTQLMGSILKAGNSARYFSVEKAFGPAAEQFAPGNEVLPFELVKKLFPKLIDVFVSPAHDALLITQWSATNTLELVVWNVAEQKQSGILALPGRPVMAESAMGLRAQAWENELRPAFQKQSTKPEKKRP